MPPSSHPSWADHPNSILGSTELYEVRNYAVLPVLLVLPYLALPLCLCVHFSRSAESTLFPEFKGKNCIIKNERICVSGLQYKQGMAVCLSQITYSSVVLRRFRKIARTDCWLLRACLSVRSHGTTRLPLEGFSWNLMFEHFSKIWQENSSFMKIFKNNGFFTWKQIYILDHISLISS